MKSIIFIPGIEATALVNANSFNFNIEWNAFDTLGSSAATSVLGPYMDEGLQLDPIYDANDEVIVERNHIARLPYESSLTTLKKKLDANIYLFGYDWRLSNVENGKRLKEYFYKLRAKLQRSKAERKDKDGFYFLTHSMGAFVFMNFVNELANDDYKDIEKVVLAAPPFKGSPYSLIHMVKGDGGVKSFLNHLFGRNENIRKVVRTYPAIYELLPYYENAITYDDNGENVDLLNIDCWQSNLIDRDKASKLLFTERLKSLAAYRSISMKFSQKLGDRTIIVVGEGDDTSTKLKVARANGEYRNFLLLDKIKDGYESGDGTVPLVSSTALKDKVLTLAVKKEDFFEQPSDFSFHGLFLRDSRVQNIIKRYFESEKKYTVTKNNIDYLQSVGGGVRIV